MGRICTIPLYVFMFSYVIPRLRKDGSDVVWNIIYGITWPE
jgi:hypothetical protein